MQNPVIDEFGSSSKHVRSPAIKLGLVNHIDFRNNLERHINSMICKIDGSNFLFAFHGREMSLVREMHFAVCLL